MRADIVVWARKMESAFEDELADRMEQVQDAEARVVAEDGGYGEEALYPDTDEDAAGARHSACPAHVLRGAPERTHAAMTLTRGGRRS